MTAPTAGSTPPQRTIAGRYRLDRMLGRGAMGAVWEAEDTVLRRPVAVKEVLLPHGLAPAERAVACERTLREARAIARLQHPNVVTLFDVLDEDGRPWVVMELVPARSLAQVVRDEGTLSPARAASIGAAVLGALEAAHAAGITHRDVKPGNILIADDGRTKLTDFGIARSAEDSALTSTGLLLGSPSYIAPEVVRGSPAGPPADLFGLGATLYAAVEGRPPFRGDDPISTLNAVASLPPDPYRSAGPLVPVLDGLLQKDPAHRLPAGTARRMLAEVAGEAGGGYLPPGAGGPPGGPPTWAPAPGPGGQPVLGPPTAPSGLNPQHVPVGVVTPPAGVPMGAAATYDGHHAGPRNPGPPNAGPYDGGQYGPPGPPYGGPGQYPPPGQYDGGGPPFEEYSDGFLPAGYEPAERRTSGKAAAAAVAALLCLVLVIGGVVLVKNVLGRANEPDRPSGNGPTTSTTPTPTATTGAAIPAGYEKYTDPQGNYSVAVPSGWTPKRTGAGRVQLTNPDDANEFFRLFTYRNGTDPMAELQSEEPGFKGRYATYQKIRLEQVQYRGLTAAEWEFTFVRDGEPKHVVYRVFTLGGRSYGVYLSAPESSFGQVRTHFDTAMTTFTSPPS